jgi:hypothetical protein
MNYVRGYTLSNAKLLLLWVFPSEFYDIKANHEEKSFDVYLKKPNDPSELQELQELIDEFRAYWSKSYKFYFITKK